jgi:formylglycine-generating enzyme required for sulfatase activity/predicted Ser/Thr protein kinase
MTDTRYRIGELLGRGGMSQVFRARDELLGREVALKFIEERDPVSTHRFLREARVQARFEHPNICRIYEVGELEGRSFIAMQLIDGRPLSALDMSLEQKVRVLREVAEAVHAAHEGGLVHRDLKPANILVERDDAGAWHPYVMDFGVAREASAGELTLTGQVLGTPMYMAPEQALGQRGVVDRRTDIYALGATLYEVLAHEPVFTGASVAEVLRLVVEQPPVPLRRRQPHVPVDLETIAMTCLRKDPAQRYPTARALADDLGAYLDGKALTAQRLALPGRIAAFARRNRAITAIMLAAIVATAGIGVGMRVAAEHEHEAAIEARVSEAGAAVVQAIVAQAGEELARNHALALFDAEQSAAEKAWDHARDLGSAVELAYGRASRAFEATLALDADLPAMRAAFADSLAAWAEWTERRGGDARELASRLVIYDDDGTRRARLDASSHVAVVTKPPGARVALSEYVSDGRGGRREEARGALGVTPLSDVTLAPGSYVLAIDASGRPPVRVPLRLTRGERESIELALPAAVPAGFVYVPAGRFLDGNANEADRKWYGTAPLHAARTDAFLIGRSEVTVGEWLAFLEALSPAERAQRTPKAVAVGHAVELEPLAGGGWRYSLRPDRDHVYSARTGELLRYPRRSTRAVQDWTKFPVTGVSASDAISYAAWLDRTGRLPGARLCRDDEWERAARGADGREYPAGDRLDKDDANVDDTYNRLDWGPDEIGSHPRSTSPFGLVDMAGNAFEWVVSARHPDRFLVRSGGYDYEAVINDVANETEISPDARGTSSGVRLCASPLPE